MYKIYQVEYGDTVDLVAKKTGTTPENIKKINGFSDDGELVVGNLIIVPNQKNEIFRTYTVKKGDSIYSIAKMFNIDPNTMLTLNGLNQSDYIYPNQELTIPNSDISVYVTKKGDTLRFITNNLGIDSNMLNNENETIFLVEDQLIIHKKERNN